MKVFLSHSTKDKDFVQQLAAAIIGAGNEKPWLCELDVALNANFVAEIERGLKWCEVALLIWSPDAAASKWTEEEWTSVLARQVAEQKTRIGIVLLRDHPLPELLRTTNYIDARTDPREAFRRAVAWLEHRESVKRFLGLPEYRPQDFVGRTVYLQQLRATFSGEPMVFLLHGEPGTGKSTLALQFAWDAQKDFDVVVFQTCGRRPLDAITAELVERLPIDVKTLPPDQQRAAAKQWLRERESLLVLDDVWAVGDGKIDIRELEPGPACSVLYTSRLQWLSGVGAKQTATLEKFSEADCEELFRTVLVPTFRPEEVNRHRDALLTFARTVEMLPIAVALGAELLREKAAIALDKGVIGLRSDILTHGVYDIDGLFLKVIKAQPEREQKLLTACAICVQEGFWLPLAAQIAGLSEAEALEAASAMTHRSLLRVIDRDRQRFQIHSLLRDQLLARAGDDGLADLQNRHASALEGLFKDWQSGWQDCRECLEEIMPAAEFLWAKGEIRREAWLCRRGYRTGLRIGELDAALRIVQQEESFWVGRDDREAKGALQRSYGDQANVLYSWGRLEEARVLQKKQEAMCLELSDKEGLEGLSRSYDLRALILRRRGRLEEAMELHKKEEAICLELGNKDGLSRSYSGQGLILHALGKPHEALELHKKVEAIALEVGNKDQLQRSYANQALILQECARPEEAMALLKKQEAICHELGNKNCFLYTYSIQARTLTRLGRLDEALRLLKEAEAICVKLDNKSGLAHCCWYWGYLARAQGDGKTEKEKLGKALALFTELKMPIEHDKVQAELDQLNSAH